MWSRYIPYTRMRKNGKIELWIMMGNNTAIIVT